MIHRAKSRLGKHKVRFLCTDIEEVSIDSRYDVIISNATFQWFNHPQRTVQRLGRSLSEQGTLLFSTFGNRTFHELHDSFQRAVQKLDLQQTHRLGQSFYSLAHLQQLCTEALNATTEDSYTIIGSEREETEYFSSVRDFFSSIQKVGASNSNHGSYCQRRTLFKEMNRTYEARYRENQRIRATYHCMYVQAVFSEES
jgi:malonyl-CoA O-methyltransferase